MAIYVWWSWWWWEGGSGRRITCSGLEILSFISSGQFIGASLVAQLVKNQPAMQEIQVQSLGGEDPLEKEMVTHSSILVWKIPWTEEPGRLQSMRLQRVGNNLATKPSPGSLMYDARV